jgi:hypothetical protein
MHVPLLKLVLVELREAFVDDTPAFNAAARRRTFSQFSQFSQCPQLPLSHQRCNCRKRVMAFPLRVTLPLVAGIPE